MRLGAVPLQLAAGSHQRQALYGADEICERHRHRYEFNNDYRGASAEAGHDRGRAYHRTAAGGDRGAAGPSLVRGRPSSIPEFKSRPNRPHPLFSGLVAAAFGSKGRLSFARVGVPKRY